MFIALFGTPSPFTPFGVHIVRVLVEMALGPYEFITAGSVEQLSTALADLRAEHIIFFTDCPDAHIVELVSTSNKPFVVFLDEPSEVVGSCKALRKLDAVGALRLTTMCFSSLHDLAISERALVVRRVDFEASLGNLVAHLAHFCGIRPTDAQLRDVIQRCAPDIPATSDVPIARAIVHHVPGADSPSAFGRALTDPRWTMAMTSATDYGAVGLRQPVQRLMWPAAAFLRGDEPDHPVEGPIDMVGGARALVYGPYLHLPPGRWDAQLFFEVRENHSGNVLKVDVQSGRMLYAGECKMPVSGSFACHMQIEIGEPRTAVEIRAFIMAGAIEGEFTLHRVEFLRVS